MRLTVAAAHVGSCYLEASILNWLYHAARRRKTNDAKFLSHDLTSFGHSERETAADNPWCFRLSSPVDAEDDFFSNRHPALADYTRLALARYLQRRDGLTDDQRNKASQLNKPELLAAIDGPPPAAAAAPVAPVAPAAVAPVAIAAVGAARGRGGRRGRAAGRAAGRGRGRVG